MKIILIGSLGLLGIYSRYFLDQLITIRPGMFPLSTLFVNLLGSFVAGILFYYSKSNPSELNQALVIGLCGGLTTFSTFSVQIFDLIESEYYLQAAGYAFLSPVLGLSMAYLGYKISLISFP